MWVTSFLLLPTGLQFEWVEDATPFAMFCSFFRAFEYRKELRFSYLSSIKGAFFVK
jgi:hypothetical protein